MSTQSENILFTAKSSHELSWRGALLHQLESVSNLIL